MKGKTANLALGLAIGTLISVVFFAGFFTGSSVEKRQYSQLGANDPNVKDFLTAYHLVTQRSFFRPFDRHHLVYAAIDGMLAATGDPHTLFLSPPENHTADQQLNGAEFSGIGAIVESACRGLDVVTPLPGSPALQAGLQRGDIIVDIDGSPVTKMTQDEAIQRVHGRTGTFVHLTVVHGKGKPHVVPVARRSIPPTTAYAYRLSHDVGYIQIVSFGDTTSDEVKSALKTLEKKPLRGLILDLRNNPGGYVDAAQHVVSQFIKSGVVAYEQSGKNTLQPLDVVDEPQAPSVPMAVLVNGESASAAEITAAALRDNGRATLVGTRTYGKGSMQSVYSLADGSSIRITDRLWLTPHKHSIGKVGITPNLTVQPSHGTGCAAQQQDSQLDAATHYVLTHHGAS